MADVVELFNILSDATGEGTAPDAKSEGNAPGQGLVGFSFKDSSGNLILPQLNSDGTIPVKSDAPGTPLRDSGVATPGALNTDVSVVTITLTASETYKLKKAGGSSFKSCVWRVEHNNNGTPDELARWVTGAGGYAEITECDCIEFTAGATGTQELKIIAQQTSGKLSDMHAFACILDLA